MCGGRFYIYYCIFVLQSKLSDAPPSGTNPHVRVRRGTRGVPPFSRRATSHLPAPVPGGGSQEGARPAGGARPQSESIVKSWMSCGLQYRPTAELYTRDHT